MDIKMDGTTIQTKNFEIRVVIFYKKLSYLQTKFNETIGVYLTGAT